MQNKVHQRHYMQLILLIPVLIHIGGNKKPQYWVLTIPLITSVNKYFAFLKYTARGLGVFYFFGCDDPTYNPCQQAFYGWMSFALAETTIEVDFSIVTAVPILVFNRQRNIRFEGQKLI